MMNRYAILILLAWTALIGFSLWWNIDEQHRSTVDVVKKIASANFNKDQAYRQWATTHGGVYVEPTEKTPPSPWMAHIPDRDLETIEGKKLTLMNPAYMLREMMDDFSDLYGIKGRIVGIVYLNKNNKADPWEAEAIREFERGLKEKIEISGSGDDEYLRLMRPMIMKQGCQKCHGHLGFPNGSVRGGVSVSVPMAEYRNLEKNAIYKIVLTHTAVWLFGLMLIGVAVYFARRQLQQREQDLDDIIIASEVFENTLDGIVITDADGVIIRVNETFCKMTGYSEDEILGNKPSMMKSEHHDDAFYATMWRELIEKGFWKGEIWNRHKDGAVYVAIESISSVRDENGACRYYIGTLHDITEKKGYEERIAYLAHYDGLTGLPNRTLFLDRLEHAISLAGREKRRLALMFLDLDGFKKVNDTKGHPVGDKLLIEVARRILGVIRRSDTVARLGGDEFTIIAEEFEHIDILGRLAMKVLEALAQEYVIEGHHMYISGSIGISVYPDDGTEGHQLLQHADTAMYQAKENGKNQYSFYEKAMTEEAHERVQLELLLLNAIENDELVVYYQPKVLLSEKKIIGVEALVRWMHPEKGMVPPDTFIPLAEEMRLIGKIDMYVLEHACQDIKRLHESGSMIHLAVNLSGYDIGSSRLVTSVSEVLERTGFDPAYLELEITETYFINFDAAAMEALDALQKLGISLSIDDFGTGYSSLGNLKKLPVDILKIDQVFIRDMERGSTEQSMVRMMINMAKILQLQVVAEGVETAYQFDYLCNEGCDFAQGYYISRPVPLDELIRVLATYRA